MKVVRIRLFREIGVNVRTSMEVRSVAVRTEYQAYHAGIMVDTIPHTNSKLISTLKKIRQGVAL